MVLLTYNLIAYMSAMQFVLIPKVFLITNNRMQNKVDLYLSIVNNSNIP